MASGVFKVLSQDRVQQPRTLLANAFTSKQKVPSHVGTSEAMGQGSCAPHSSGPVLEALQEQPDWEDPQADRWPGPEVPTLANAACDAALKGSADCLGPSPPPHVSGGTAAEMHFV